MRKRFVLQGFEQAFVRKKRAKPPTPAKLDDEVEAKLIAIHLGNLLAGYSHCSLQLLADELVALEIVDSIYTETIRNILKNGMPKRKIEYWVIPPKQNVEFVENMEEVLENYAKPYDSAHPRLFKRERSVSKF